MSEQGREIVRVRGWCWADWSLADGMSTRLTWSFVAGRRCSRDGAWLHRPTLGVSRGWRMHTEHAQQ